MFDARLVSLSADVDAERHQHRQHSEQDSSVHLASRIGLDRLACRFQQFYLTRPTQASAILSNPDANRAMPSFTNLLDGTGAPGVFPLRARGCACSPEGEHEPDGQENSCCQRQSHEFEKNRAEEFTGGKAQLLAQPNPGTDVENIKANRAVAGCPTGGIKEQGNHEDASHDPQRIDESSYVGQFLRHSQFSSG
jgi:hypothetical protein